MSNSLQTLLRQHKLDPDALLTVLNNGLDIEKLNLEVSRQLGDSDQSYEIECRVLQAEILLSLLRCTTLQT